jgi:hypothetical protein
MAPPERRPRRTFNEITKAQFVSLKTQILRFAQNDKVQQNFHAARAGHPS